VLSLLDNYQALGSIDETTLLNCYFPAIANGNSTPFTGFTMDHRDAYLRLHVRAECMLRQGAAIPQVPLLPEDLAQGLDAKVAALANRL